MKTSKIILILVCYLMAYQNLFSANKEQDYIKIIECKVPNLIQTTSKISDFIKEINPNAQMMIATTLIAINFAPGINNININKNLYATIFLKDETDSKILWALKAPEKKTEVPSQNLENKGLYIAKLGNDKILSNSKSLSLNPTNNLFEGLQNNKDIKDYDCVIKINPKYLPMLSENFQQKNNITDAISKQFENILLKLNISNEKINLNIDINPKENSSFAKQLTQMNNEQITLNDLIKLLIENNSELKDPQINTYIALAVSALLKKSISLDELKTVFESNFQVKKSKLIGELSLNRKEIIKLLQKNKKELPVNN